MTKTQKAMNRKIEWNTAIAQGRVVRAIRAGEPTYFAAFATPEDAVAMVGHYRAIGTNAAIIDPSQALTEYVKGGR